MIRRFEGGPLDGLEEQAERAPHVMFRLPPVSEQPEGYPVMYELIGMEWATGTALYLAADPELPSY